MAVYRAWDNAGSEMYVWVPAKAKDYKRSFVTAVTGFSMASMERIDRPTAQQTREAKENTNEYTG